MYLKKAKTGLALLLCMVFFASCATVPAESSSQQNNTSSLHTSSAAVSSTEAVSSKPAASSKAPASSETVSSEVYVPLNLKQNPDEMLTTICSVAYVDKNGVLHYNPTFLAKGDLSDFFNPKELDVSTLPDGTKGVRGVYAAYNALYALMEDGTVKVVSQNAIDDQTKEDPVKEVIKETSTWKNVRYLHVSEYGHSSTDAIMPWGFRTDTQGVISGTVAECEKMLWEGECAVSWEKVVQLAGVTVLYRDGTIDSGSALIREKVKDWKNVIQIAVVRGHLLALQSDGILKTLPLSDAAPEEAFIPQEYCRGVRNLFERCLQLEDGTVYDIFDGQKLGVYEQLDQVFETYAKIGVTEKGETVLLQGKAEEEHTAWLLSLTDVKTKSPAK